MCSLCCSCCSRMGPTVRAFGSHLPQLNCWTVLFNSVSGKTAESFSSGLKLRKHQALRFQLSTPVGGRSYRVPVLRCKKNPRDSKSGDSAKPIFLTSEFWLQVAIFLFAAGVVDAGFSGDWSRIGILTKEAEIDVQMAAIGVVPLAGTLIWSIAQRRKL